jgi:hypothetical protein
MTPELRGIDHAIMLHRLAERFACRRVPHPRRLIPRGRHHPLPVGAELRNKNTRIAYYHAIGQFLDWCQRAGFRGLEDIEPITVAAYVEHRARRQP